MAGPRHVWVLVPAAGESRRFREAGYATPKPRLRVAHRDLVGGAPRRMLHHVLAAIPDASWPRLVALPPPGDAADLVGSAADSLYQVLVGKTRGQADTLRQMVRNLPQKHLDETALLIINSDVVFRCGEDLAWIVDRALNGFVVSALVTKSDSPAMSYAHPYPCPQKFVEKRVLGQHAMVGAWAVASATRLLYALDWACCQGASVEPYLSHALNKIHGPKIVREVEPDTFLDWGTPAAVSASGASILK